MQTALNALTVSQSSILWCGTPWSLNRGHFEDKERILEFRFGLKDSAFAIREDFSIGVRRCRSQLVLSAKARNAPFKLRFHKLILDNCTYLYDEAWDWVKMVNKLQQNSNDESFIRKVPHQSKTHPRKDYGLNYLVYKHLKPTSKTWWNVRLYWWH